uniref:L-seryl-tRNA(Sec) kinase n=2 Tax=Macrostomum lignano TaxID=282301 RepID=A0A1I8FXB4_9PLAT
MQQTAKPDGQQTTALLIVMGLPGCGKTTLCSSLCRSPLLPAASAPDSATIRCHHVEFDSFVPDSAVQIGANYDSDEASSWKLARQALLKSLDKLLCRLVNGSKTYFSDDDDASLEPDLTGLMTEAEMKPADWGRVILLDDNFYYASMRHAVFQLARHYSCGFGTVYLKASLAQLKLVNSIRDKPVPPAVIDRMWERLEAPNPERNPWEKFVCLFGQSDLGFLDSAGHYSDSSVNGRLHSLIRDCLANPFEPPADPELAAKQAAEAREVCSMSLLHQADLRLRAIVSDWLATQSESEKAELGKLAATNKRAVMSALTSGKLKVPAPLNSFSPDKKDALDKFLMENFSLPTAN